MKAMFHRRDRTTPIRVGLGTMTASIGHASHERNGL